MLTIRKYLTLLNFLVLHRNIYRNSIDKLCVNYSCTNIRKFSFSNRVPPVWNKLPELVKKAPNVNSFKNVINRQTVLVDIFHE